MGLNDHSHAEDRRAVTTEDLLYEQVGHTSTD
jgi:hypothetical protein